jgi:sec-independent protein translocase protein TatC
MTGNSNHTSSDTDTAAVDIEQPFISHLVELRDRLLRVVLAVAVVFIVLIPFANTLFSELSGPLMAHMPSDSSMIAIEVASPFLIPFKLTLFLAVFASIPFILYQAWSFIAPGLYRNERRLVVPLLVSSTLLFYAGAAFAYFVVFPLVFAFFTSSAPEGVSVMTDISRYLDFVLTLFFAFGAAFEVPIVTVLLVMTGMSTQQSLRKKRPYIIVGAFVIGMLLTPPDVISQTLLAIPMWLLFELGVFFSGWFVRQKEVVAGHDEETDDYKPLSEAEMDAELDRIEAEEKE